MRTLLRFLVGRVVAALPPNAPMRERTREMQASTSIGTSETLLTGSVAAHPLRGEASRLMRPATISFLRPGSLTVVMQGAWSHCLLALCLFAVVPVPAHAQIVASGQTLSVTTANATATFKGPDLIGFTNSTTGESYLKLAPSSPLMNLETLAGTGQRLTSSEWTTSVHNGTTIASLTMQDSVRSVTIAVNVDATSQEIVVKLWGQATQAGVTSAYWVMAGLDLSAGRLIVPASAGIVFDPEHPAWGTSMRYPNDWQAQMLVYETSAGSMVLYSTDSQYLFKQLRIGTRGSSTLDLSIATEAIGPWPSATSVPAVEWRLRAFTGDWRTAASVYRDWLVANRPRMPNASDSWAQSIRTVVTLHSLDSTLLDTLANLLTPSRTLIYLPNWRLASYDVNYPDYTPAPGVAALVVKAHALGFKVMLHTDMIGVSPTNPDYASVQSWQVKDPRSLELMGWMWSSPPSTPNRFAFINPASSFYRRLFVERVRAAVTAVQPDALHLDISAPMLNDGNGPIEAMTYPQGAVQLHKDLVAAFPNLALGGEGMNDVIYAYNSFAQPLWGGAGISGGPPGHPIANFLWNSQDGGQMRYYGHLAQPHAADPSFKSFVSQIERRGILPALVVGSSSDLDLANPDNARLLKWLQSWQTNGFEPDWYGSWSGVLIPYKAAPDSTATAALTDTETLVRLDGGGTPIYQRAHHTVQQDTASYVLNWPAFDATRIYGLDSTAQYWLDAVPRPSTTHISNLSPAVRLGADTMVSSSFALIQLAPTPTYDFVANLWAATIGTTHDGIDGPLPLGNLVMVTTTTAGGVARQGIFMHPPDAQAGAAEETFVEWSLPVLPSAVFTFSVGVDDAAGTCTDGVTFRVVVNGVQAWRQHVLHEDWIDGRVDLSAYAGTTVRLRIATHPGPANNWGCDWASFSALALSPLDPVTTSVPLTLASGATPSGFSGSGVLSVSGPGTVQVNGVSVPGEFTLFLAPGTAIDGAPNLASLPFGTWLGSENELPTPGGSIFGSGSVSTATAGGVSKQNAIFAHPPIEGRTILTWVLAVPASGGLLSWSAALGDTAVCTSGVRFEVRINGRTYWTLFQPAPAGWSQGALGLSAWRGTNILLQLVTNSVGDFNCDHAWWADLVVGTDNADLIITTITADSSAAAGSSTFVSATVKNQGNGGAGASRLEYFVSPNAFISAGDVDTNSYCNIPALSAGSSYTCSGGITVPSSLVSGTYYLGALADFGKAVTETSETNNSRAASSPTVITGAYSWDYVEKAYVAYYGRPGDPAGLAYWATRMDNEGGSLSSIIAAFGYSDEFNRRYGGLTYAALVTKIYQQALGRDPDPAGLNWYVGELMAGRRTLQTITLDVLNGATTTPDSTVVANKLDVAAHYTSSARSGCAYGTEQDGVSIILGVTASPATVTAAKAMVDGRCSSF